MGLTTTNFRQNIKCFFGKALNIKYPSFISVFKEYSMALSKSEDAGMQETSYLLSSPKNAERLLKSIEQNKTGKMKVHGLVD